MYHPTEMANAVTPTSWFYSIYIHTPSNQIQCDNPSRLKISFLLDSCAFISVLNYPTYVTIAKLLVNKQNNTLNPSKTLTVANQTEIFILHYVTITLNTTIEDGSRQFTIPFAVADLKYIFLGTPFFEQNIQNINIQVFTLQFKHQSTVHPAIQNLHHSYPKITHFSHSFIVAILKQVRLKPNSSKIAHFPIKNYYNLHVTTTPQIEFFPTIQHTYFSTKFPTTFNFKEIFTDDKPDNWRLLYKTLQIILQHYLQDILDILKFQLQMKNSNIIMSLIITLLYTMLPIHTILKSQKLFHKLITRYNIKMTQFLFINFHYTKYI